MSNRPVLLLTLLAFCYYVQQAAAVVVFDYGQTHNIDYEINDHVTVDLHAPGMGTALNILSGGRIVAGMDTWEDSAITIISGVLESLNMYGRSTVNMSGGSIENHLQACENATVRVTGGSISQVIGAQQYAQVTLSGGSVGYLYTDDDAQITVLGGMIDDRVELYDHSLVTFSGSGFNYGYGELPDVTGVLTGTLTNGDTLSVRFDRFQSARIVLVPEPSTALLLSLGGLALLRRRYRS